MRNAVGCILAFLALFLTGISCQEAPMLSIEGPSVLELPQGGSSTVTFTANRDWTVSVSEDWLSVQPSKGTGSEVPVTLKVQGLLNTTHENRTATLTLLSGGLTRTVTVNQPANIAVLIPEQAYLLTREAQTLEVEIQSNVQPEVIISADWIVQSGTRGLSTLHPVFSVQENTTFERRYASVEFWHGDGSLLGFFAVTQEGRIPVANVTLDRTELRMREGGTETLVATLEPGDAWRDISWSTSDAGVATVDDGGRISAVKEGYAVITVHAGTMSAACEVTVTPEGIIPFADPVMKGILVERFDTDGDGELSYDEAEAVTSFGELGTHPEVTSFDEFRYFSGLDKKMPRQLFKDWTGLVSDSIPDQMTFVGTFAFQGCTSLSSVILPRELTEIGGYAFEGCTSLASITLPAKTNWIGTYAFYRCRGLVSIDIPSGLGGIGDYAFYECTSLRSIDLPDAVNDIKRYVFGECTSLVSARLPSRMATIPGGLFLGCSALSSFTLPEGITEIESHAFYGCSSLTSIRMPDTVTVLNGCAFEGCTSLSSVTLSNRLSFMATSVFRGCSSLKSIRIPDSVTFLYTRAFEGCSSLTSVTLPQNLTYLEEHLFEGCSSLLSIDIPYAVTEIKPYAFAGCSSLSALTLHHRVQSVGSHAFDGCSSLSTLTVQDGSLPLSIGSEAFKGCSGLSSAVLPDRVSRLGDHAFAECTGLASVTLPKGLTKMEDSLFSGCTSLTDISLPDGVTRLGMWVFYRCGSLPRIHLPEGLITISHAAFYGCASLTELTIPGTVKTIDNWAFLDCTGLNALIVRCPVPPKLHSGALINTNDCPIIVPSGSGDAYRSAEGWRGYVDRIREE